MRKLLLLSLLSCSVITVARTGQVAERIERARSQGARFQAVHLFQEVPPSRELTARWSEELGHARAVRPDGVATRSLAAAPPAYITLAVPGPDGTYTLDLEHTVPTTDDFRISTASGRPAVLQGAHYRGMVRGVPGSWAAISVFDGEVMGLFNDGQGQLVVGRLQDRIDDVHVVYRDRDLRHGMDFTCGTRESGHAYDAAELVIGGAERTTRCVRYYWEVNYNIYQDKGSIAATTNYITGLFNQSALLFDNDGIDVTLSELFIWDEASPYSGPASGDYLDQFGVTRTSFNGDMAHLVGYGGGGGVAWLNTLCNGQSLYRMAYSGINSTYSNVPTYSWSTMVVTHEAGHNLGSSHTHGCVWNGNGTSIDGCGPTANPAYSEGSCPVGPIPSGGGTIMSYCHLVSAGINLSLGFGPQPTAVIVNAVNGAGCLTACGTTCDAPGTLTATSITANAAVLSWSAVGANSYNLRWRQSGAPGWTNVNGLATATYNLGSLVQGTTYEFQVMAICTSLSSAWSATQTFTTPVPCPDAHEPNNTQATAPTLPLPVDISALIATSSDADYYKFTIGSTATVNITLTNLAGDYDLRLLNAAGTQLAVSQVGGTASESITQNNLAAGTYTVHVYGYDGVFSATQCYVLAITVPVPPCEQQPPVRVAAKVFLDGAYKTANSLMVDSLRAKGLLPMNEPYSALGHTVAGPTTIASSVLNTTGNNAIVDWVLVELRNPASAGTVVEARVALLQRDGDVVGLDGTSSLGFCSSAGNYYVAVRHRNHLGVMTAEPRTLGSSATTVDFTVPGTLTYGANATRPFSGRHYMWAGNTSGDAVIRYTGQSNDRDPVLVVVGASVPTATVAGYRREDCNLDGRVRYIGANNDRDLILGTVGGSVPTATVTQQLP